MAEFISDNDEQNDSTTYDKGREFENEFSEFMKRELGWNKVRVGAHMAGKENVKGAAIDIIGERLDVKGKLFNLWFIVLFCIGFLFMIYGIFWSAESWGDGGMYFLYTSICLCLFLVFLSNVAVSIIKKTLGWSVRT